MSSEVASRRPLCASNFLHREHLSTSFATSISGSRNSFRNIEFVTTRVVSTSLLLKKLYRFGAGLAFSFLLDDYPQANLKLWGSVYHRRRKSLSK